MPPTAPCASIMPSPLESNLAAQGGGGTRTAWASPAAGCARARALSWMPQLWTPMKWTAPISATRRAAQSAWPSSTTPGRSMITSSSRQTCNGFPVPAPMRPPTTSPLLACARRWDSEACAMENMLKRAFLGGVIAALFILSAQADTPADSQQSEKARLGQAMFFDPSLSSPPGQSCATCHDASAALTDPDRRLPVSKGVLPGHAGNRNTPTARYAAFSPDFHFDKKEGLYVGGQFLDGRAATLEQQARGPFLNPLEMANPDKQSVVEKVRRAAYRETFDSVFGKGALDDPERAYEYIAEALAAFERTAQFSPFSSKYDAYLAGKAQLSQQEMRGLRLFEAKDKGNCAACHTSRPGPKGEPPLFTDFTYDNLGVPRNPDNPFYKLPARLNPAGALWVDRGLGATVNKRSEDGKFKVPTLRNIELTGPYMHNGYFRTLGGAVAFYNDRDRKPLCARNLVTEETALKQKCWPAPEVITNVNHDELGDLGLTEREIDDIVAFMRTLTDGWQGQAKR